MKEVLVLAIPRGGVEVGMEMVRTLDADFSLVDVSDQEILEIMKTWQSETRRDFSQITDSEVKALLRQANGGAAD